MQISDEMITAFKMKFHDKASDDLDYNTRLRVSLEAALSAAEPYGWMVKTKGSAVKGTFFGHEPHFSDGTWDRDDYDVIPVYDRPQQPAPSVVVKALEWVEHQVSFPCPLWSAEIPFGVYSIEEASASDSPVYEVRLHSNKMVAIKDSLSEAKAAAQADYEAGIRSALSAQVQDVAGWRPIETAPKERQQRVLLTLPNGRVTEGWWGAAKYNRSKKEYDLAWVSSPYSGDVSPTHWMPLPAAPAKQEGGESQPVHKPAVDSGESGDE